MRRLLVPLFFCNSICASDLMFLCGTDEDGCSSANYRYCRCIPYDEQTAHQPYCLNFNNLSCVPLSSQPDCQAGEIYPDQATCVAVLWQSEPSPTCPLKTEAFCRQNGVPVCEQDGDMNTCH